MPQQPNWRKNERPTVWPSNRPIDQTLARPDQTVLIMNDVFLFFLLFLNWK